MNKIKELSLEERPYEKFEQFGAENLTNIELLAILLRTGTKGQSSLELARKILYGPSEEGILNIHNWTFEQLMNIKGIGKVKAIQILCISELAKRLAKGAAGKQLDFNTPDKIAKYYMEDLRHKKQEFMKLLLLNTKSKLICDKDISIGTVNTAIISPRELFVEALQNNAVCIILLHNHPSGDPTPSVEDVQMTMQIREAGNLIGIPLLDHIIIGDNCYISLKEEGYFQ